MYIKSFLFFYFLFFNIIAYAQVELKFELDPNNCFNHLEGIKNLSKIKKTIPILVTVAEKDFDYISDYIKSKNIRANFKLNKVPKLQNTLNEFLSIYIDKQLYKTIHFAQIDYHINLINWLESDYQAYDSANYSKFKVTDFYNLYNYKGNAYLFDRKLEKLVLLNYNNGFNSYRELKIDTNIWFKVLEKTGLNLNKYNTYIKAKSSNFYKIEGLSTLDSNLYLTLSSNYPYFCPQLEGYDRFFVVLKTDEQFNSFSLTHFYLDSINADYNKVPFIELSDFIIKNDTIYSNTSPFIKNDTFYIGAKVKCNTLTSELQSFTYNPDIIKLFESIEYNWWFQRNEYLTIAYYPIFFNVLTGKQIDLRPWIKSSFKNNTKIENDLTTANYARENKKDRLVHVYDCYGFDVNFDVLKVVYNSYNKYYIMAIDLKTNKKLYNKKLAIKNLEGPNPVYFLGNNNLIVNKKNGVKVLYK